MKRRSHIVHFIHFWWVIFVVLFVISFSFPFQILPNVGGWFSNFYEVWATLTASMLGYSTADPLVTIEDGPLVIFHVLNVLLLSLVVGLIVYWKLKDQKELKIYFTAFVRHYLALILLVYGFNKVFKYQFYYPEPNILYSKVMDLPIDMLYWTTMGKSYFYSLFGGLIEVVPALLLLFRKTYVLGALLAFLVLLNVVAINIGFDITVKAFSIFLLLLSLYLLFPYLKTIYQFFLGQRDSRLAVPIPNYRNSKYYFFSKVSVIVLIFLESTILYLKVGYVNDDMIPRPYLHGGYEVKHFIIGQDTISNNWENDFRWKRLFVHRQGYCILQTMDEKMQDFKLEIDSANHVYQLIDYDKKVYQFKFEKSKKRFILIGTIQDQPLRIEMEQVYKY